MMQTPPRRASNTSGDMDHCHSLTDFFYGRNTPDDDTNADVSLVDLLEVMNQAAKLACNLNR
jgi:hypothetical protein